MFIPQSGKLSGADMVVYLLEKSRLTYQQPLERCYHAFYNLMSDQVPKKRHQSSVKFYLVRFLTLKQNACSPTTSRTIGLSRKGN